MKRGIGFGKIGLNLGQMKIGDKDQTNKEDDGGGGFGSFGTKPNEIKNLLHEVDKKEESEFVEEVNPDIAKIMGFSGFSSTVKGHANKLTPRVENQTAPNTATTTTTKKAQQFDVDSMFAAVAKSAFEKNFEKNQQLEEEGRAELEKDYVAPVQSDHKLKKSDTKTEDTKSDQKKADGSDDSSDDSDDDDVVGPLPPPPPADKTKKDTNKDGQEEDEEDEEGYREETPVDKIPHSHEVALSHGEKAITRYTQLKYKYGHQQFNIILPPSLALDPSGSRVISGSADYELKFWDFAGNMIDLYSNIIHSSREGILVQVSLMSSVHYKHARGK